MISKKLLRVQAQRAFRRTGTLALVERMRYYYKCLSYLPSNNRFCKQNPQFILPPSHLAFDAYSAPAWKFYKESGEGTANFLKTVAEKYFPDKPPAAICEWGCGPGRVVRHLPAQFGDAVEIYGTDYNPETIAWCQANLPGINFRLNGLNPPLPFVEGKFDLVYCLSVFTHLSAETGIAWVAELHRVLKPGGVLLMTTSGDSFYATELLTDEQEAYRNVGIVVRGDYDEGKKMFLTRHNPEYVKSTLLKQFELLEHLPAGFPYTAQDCWIARKPLPAAAV